MGQGRHCHSEKFRFPVQKKIKSCRVFKRRLFFGPDTTKPRTRRGFEGLSSVTSALSPESRGNSLLCGRGILDSVGALYTGQIRVVYYVAPLFTSNHNQFSYAVDGLGLHELFPVRVVVRPKWGTLHRADRATRFHAFLDLQSRGFDTVGEGNYTDTTLKTSRGHPAWVGPVKAAGRESVHSAGRERRGAGPL